MAEQTARFRDVFAVGEFRVLWIAQTQSRIGDQFARVALALLIFERTSSAVLTALVYASTYLPPLLTAPLLAGLADRYSRRTVMWAVELLRAALIGIMAIPAVPLPALAVLVVAASCFDPLFSAARIATLPKVLPGGRYQVGMSISSSTDGIAQIAGFALGGIVVAATGSPHLVLAIDAVSFLVSAALLRWGLRPHLPASESDGAASRAGGFALAGIRLVAGDRRLMGLAALVWLFGLFVVPEAMAAPYAAELGRGEAAVGVLMAADVVGMVIGGLLVARLGSGLRRRLTVPLAFAAGLPLVATLIAPNVVVTVALWALSGLMSSYLVLAQVRFVQLVPDGMRARAVGFAAAGLQTAQGLGMVIAGGLAEAMPPSAAIAVCGAAGSLGAVVISLAFGLAGASEAADPERSPAAAGDRAEPSRT
ncbi:MFS transporter [Glycomyces tritici]|uniref:MFS transporter n=1 Tax=Glycomyces tritici TaxID=2665176 RepID=A0ABT7YWB8_9ACTN|nr:MFS transporter [Glycomyces tritici]MDN3242945.1 MFS transporter [Glycomyces tritici]